ncbi:MAG: HAMP domain-containing histidine kinase [Gammaproteobacteria bacterium]|nr:HAMP domain-containing histidine kinase [Gammaproteobacteria bacterium]
MQFALLLEQRWSDRKVLQQEEQPFLEIISSAGTRARNMINALLQLSRATTTKLNIEPIALDSLIEAITGELRSEYPQKEITINLDALSQTINADKNSLKMAIKAILDNGVRFCSDHEQVKISIQITAHEDRIDLTFKDSGKGILLKLANQVTQCFYQVERDPEDLVHLDIGLTTANRIALRHNGGLSLEPETDNAEYGWPRLSSA